MIADQGLFAYEKRTDLSGMEIFERDTGIKGQTFYGFWYHDT
jgi:hypothetical protein